MIVLLANKYLFDFIRENIYKSLDGDLICIKNICIVNQYATNSKDGMGGRHYYISKSLVKQGFNVTIVSASFSHVKEEELKQTVYFKLVTEMVSDIYG